MSLIKSVTFAFLLLVLARVMSQTPSSNKQVDKLETRTSLQEHPHESLWSLWASRHPHLRELIDPLLFWPSYRGQQPHQATSLDRPFMQDWTPACDVRETANSIVVIKFRFFFLSRLPFVAYIVKHTITETWRQACLYICALITLLNIRCMQSCPAFRARRWMFLSTTIYLPSPASVRKRKWMILTSTIVWRGKLWRWSIIVWRGAYWSHKHTCTQTFSGKTHTTQSTQHIHTTHTHMRATHILHTYTHNTHF